MLERWLDRYYASMHRADADGPPWRAGRFMMQTATWLTAEELAELNEELSAVMRRYRERLTDADQRPEGSRLCELVAWGVPIQVGDGP
jgi:hypothetical protein